MYFVSNTSGYPTVTFEEEDDCYKPIKHGNFGDKIQNLSVKEYLNGIKPYLKDIITDLQKSGTCKVQLAIAVNFIFYS